MAALNSVPVLHLLASNPSIPESLMQRLAKHSSFEVHTGLVTNPAIPLPLLLSFRTPGKYTTVNDALARNPKLPAEVLSDMYNRREIGKIGAALNPHCPPEIMWRILAEGSSTDRAWLATNPSLPSDLIAKLEVDPNRVVRSYLATNPSYKKLHHAE